MHTKGELFSNLEMGLNWPLCNPLVARSSFVFDTSRCTSFMVQKGARVSHCTIQPCEAMGTRGTDLGSANVMLVELTMAPIMAKTGQLKEISKLVVGGWAKSASG